MAKREFINELNENITFLDAEFLLDNILKKVYIGEMYNAMKIIYNSGILSIILSEQYCDNKMFSTFMRRLSNEFGISKVVAKDALMEWIEVCEEIYGLLNYVDFNNIFKLSSEDYKPNFGFLPYIEIGEIYDYQTNIKKCRSGNADLKSIGIVMGILNHYLFRNIDYISNAGGIDEVNQNKKVTLNIMEDTVLLLKNNRYLQANYMLWLAQIRLLKGEFESAIELYETLLQIKEIVSPQNMDENFYCGELEDAAMIAHNVVCAYTLAGKLEKAEETRKKYKKIFDIEKTYNKKISRQCCSSTDEREYYKKKIFDLCENNNIAYFDLRLHSYIHGSERTTLEAIYLDNTKSVGPTFLLNMVGLEMTEFNEIIVTDYEDSDEPILMKISINVEKKSDSNCKMKSEPNNNHEQSIMLKSDSICNQSQADAFEKVNVAMKKDSPYDRLNDLVGLDMIKSDVNNLVNLMKMQIRRSEQGFKTVPVSLHLVFTGNPGTGKTTIARILADIYKEIGILSKGHLVEVDRSGLVAGYVGQTAIKTQEKINEALGGILFIDEAYTLVKDGNDYGQEAIDTILKAMEDYRNDFIVIVAGYSDLMDKFMNSNPGLKSRFNKYINFPDYTADEMIKIFVSMCEEYSFELSVDAKTVMQEKIYDLEANKGENFANARDVRNLFERVITNQASRLAMIDTDDIMRITAEDFD